MTSPCERADIFPGTSMPDRDWWMALFADPVAILRKLGARPGMRALDLCCGDGYFTAPLARMLDGEVFALDLDPALIDQARAELARQAATVRGLIVADARDADRHLPEPVDYVLIANTLHGVPDHAALLATIMRCLRPGGLLAVLNWHPLPREETPVMDRPRGPDTALRMSSDATAKLLDRAGFAIEAVVAAPPYHYGITARSPTTARAPSAFRSE